MTDLVPFSGHTLCNSKSELGEGPTFDPGTGTAWWFNITGQQLHELHLDSGRKTSHSLPFLGSVLAVIDPLRQLIASDQGLFIRDTKDFKLSHFARLEDKPGNRSNDGRVHPCGALWIGTMGRKAEKHAGAIYHVARNRVTKLYSNITMPNGICFSPDGAAAYFTDTDVNHLMRVELDPLTALPTGDPVLLSDESANPGGIDGAVCDADGLIWNARWGAGAVEVYKPDGQKVARYALPASQPSCPAFVGAKAERLLVTSARQGLNDAEHAADPHAGKTFELGIEVKGRFEPAFRL
ncbi:SMP-30/gluconolactonase/LRE family protein [Sinorhizobium medicae]|nr:SMP-30/gluconolactonase/LRE family protein [Sinorhizobium medicae]MDX0726243.1 SMP-30/gluconolactonase/LRE family protein [Sinorhizobium medicae]MDX0731428.1 SMP-30/gluconolactonase/LRE family protein [Sinorhizobium medicae]MDX0812030.1 SMP-30/gluconolactonase/LRE family protein [Sinorhizobium medicae]MDX1098747.1 SMP-30/gluconolactonase/LRE family protein [Sinorhizobium medicae]